jgi:hypothetical protein
MSPWFLHRGTTGAGHSGHGFAPSLPFAGASWVGVRARVVGVRLLLGPFGCQSPFSPCVGGWVPARSVCGVKLRVAVRVYAGCRCEVQASEPFPPPGPRSRVFARVGARAARRLMVRARSTRVIGYWLLVVGWRWEGWKVGRWEGARARPRVIGYRLRVIG